ncbi:MAG: CopG family transcriptional regulator [Vicingaceae bacterium]
MGRQSISFTEPNDNWVKSQVTSKEYASKSELVNDLIRQARGQQQKIDWLAAKLDRAKRSGISKNSAPEILAKSKASYNG